MEKEKIYGREALRRLREQQAAKAAEAAKEPTPAATTKPAVQPSVRTKRRQIHIAVSTDEEQIIEELARREGMTPSNWFRAGRGMPIVDPHRPNVRKELRRREWVRWMKAQLKSRDNEPK